MMMTKKIKIIYPVTTFKRGGVTSILYNILTFIDKAKFEPVLLILGSYDGSLIQGLRKRNISCYCIRYKNIFSIFSIIKIIKREGVNIYHGNPGKISRLSALLAGVRNIVSTYHGTYYNISKVYLWLDRLLNMFTDKFVCISKSVALFVRVYFKIPNDKIRVVYNGIDPDEAFNPIKHNEIANDIKQHAEFIITSVTYLSVEKGVSDFIIAAKEVVKKMSNVKFVIVGDGTDKKKFVNLIKDNGLVEKVLLVGQRADIAAVLNASTIVVLPSCMREGLGLALIEAMAMKIPVIGTSIEGIKEVIDDGINGYLVPTHSPTMISCKILDLLNNPELRKKMGEAGREKVVKKFNIRYKIKELEDLYLNLLYPVASHRVAYKGKFEYK